MTNFIVFAYKDKRLTWSQANYVLRESCGLIEEAIKDLLPLDQDAANP